MVVVVVGWFAAAKPVRFSSQDAETSGGQCRVSCAQSCGSQFYFYFLCKTSHVIGVVFPTLKKFPCCSALSSPSRLSALTVSLVRSRRWPVSAAFCFCCHLACDAGCTHGEEKWTLKPLSSGHWSQRPGELRPLTTGGRAGSTRVSHPPVLSQSAGTSQVSVAPPCVFLVVQGPQLLQGSPRTAQTQGLPPRPWAHAGRQNESPPQQVLRFRSVPVGTVVAGLAVAVFMLACAPPPT